MITKHYQNDRTKREQLINDLGDSYIIDGFVMDKGHKNGLEVHSITSKGVIIIHNMTTGELITKLIARPHQIERYYELTGRETPKEYDEVIRLANWYKILGFNNY